MARLTPITSKDQVAPEAHAIVDGIVKSRGALHHRGAGRAPAVIGGPVAAARDRTGAGPPTRPRRRR